MSKTIRIKCPACRTVQSAVEGNLWRCSCGFSFIATKKDYPLTTPQRATDKAIRLNRERIFCQVVAVLGILLLFAGICVYTWQANENSDVAKYKREIKANESL